MQGKGPKLSLKLLRDRLELLPNHEYNPDFLFIDNILRPKISMSVHKMTV